MRPGRGILILVLAAMAFAAGPAIASPTPFHLEFDRVLLDFANLKDVDALDATGDDPDPKATLDGTVEGTSLTIPKSGFFFPTKRTELAGGLDGEIKITANRAFTGSWNAVTGELTFGIDLKADIDIYFANSPDPYAACVINPIRSVVSTGYGKPRLGVPFTGGLDGTGAVNGAWEDMPAPKGGDACQIVTGIVSGPGGIWLGHQIPEADKCEDNPTHPGCNSSDPCANGPSSLCCVSNQASESCVYMAGPKRANLKIQNVKPKRKRVRAGKAVTVTVKVKNTGGAVAKGVKLCLVKPGGKKGRQLKLSGCAKGKIAPGKTLTRKLKVKTKRNARGKYRIPVRVKAPGLPARQAAVTLTVRR